MLPPVRKGNWTSQGLRPEGPPPPGWDRLRRGPQWGPAHQNPLPPEENSGQGMAFPTPGICILRSSPASFPVRHRAA